MSVCVAAFHSSREHELSGAWPHCFSRTQVCVVGLKEYNVEEVGIVKQLIESASQQRSVGTTAANSDSSRSHSIMQFALKSGSDKLVGKLSFIDLAGAWVSIAWLGVHVFIHVGASVWCGCGFSVAKNHHWCPVWRTPDMCWTHFAPRACRANKQAHLQNTSFLIFCYQQLLSS